MLFMGIDVGSSGCKTSVMDEHGRVVGFAAATYGFTYENGKSELDAQVVRDRVFDTIRQVSAEHDLTDLKTVSVTSFGEMFVLLDGHRQILAPSITYEDPRGGEDLAAFLETVSAERVYHVTGATPDAMYSLAKLLWIKRHNPAVYEKARYCCLFADFILMMLGADHHIDYSLAARTLLFDVANKQWSSELLGAAELNTALFGPPVASGTPVGTVTPAVAQALGLPKTVTLLAGGHDQPCTALGAGILTGGYALDGMGTNECIVPAFDRLMVSPVMRQSQLVCVPHIVPNLYVTYAFNRSAGSLVRWYQRTVGETDVAAMIEAMDEAPSGLFVLPHFAGAATPYMDNEAVGAILGLKLDTEKTALIKGIFEGLNYEMMVNLRCLQQAGFTVKRLHAAGGMAKSDRVLQLKADMMGVPVARLAHTETGTLGTVMLGGVAMGRYDSLTQAAEALVQVKTVFEPHDDVSRYYEERFARYAALYDTVKTFYGRG